MIYSDPLTLAQDCMTLEEIESNPNVAQKDDVTC